MTFEEALIQLKSGQKIIRQGWGGLENYIKLVESTSLDGEVLNPYFVIHVTGEGYTMFQPTVCDILAEDWALVEG